MGKLRRGYGFNINLESVFGVYVPNVEDKWEAEDKAWDILADELNKNDDLKDSEMETVSIDPSVNGWDVKIKTTTKVYAVAVETKDAMNEAEGVVDLPFPEGIRLVSTNPDDCEIVEDGVYVRCAS